MSAIPFPLSGDPARTNTTQPTDGRLLALYFDRTIPDPECAEAAGIPLRQFIAWSREPHIARQIDDIRLWSLDRAKALADTGIELALAALSRVLQASDGCEDAESNPPSPAVRARRIESTRKAAALLLRFAAGSGPSPSSPPPPTPSTPPTPPTSGPITPSPRHPTREPLTTSHESQQLTPSPRPLSSARFQLGSSHLPPVRQAAESSTRRPLGRPVPRSAAADSRRANARPTSNLIDRPRAPPRAVLSIP